MIKLATIGTSWITESFIAGAMLTGEFELSAVYSRSLEKANEFASKHGAKKVFTNLEKMAKSDDIEAVYIASPNGLHYEQSRLFLENGKHVICEKPIATRVKEYIELKNLADSKSLIYMEAIIPIYTDGSKKLKEAISKIGNIQLARFDFSQYSSKMERFLNGEKISTFDMSLKGGALMDLGVYCVYAALDLLGIPNDVVAFKTLIKNGVDGSGCAIFKYDNFNALLSYSKTGQSQIGSEIIGDKATIKIKMISQYTGVYLVEKEKETLIVDFLPKPELMSGEAKQFAEYILNFQENKELYVSNSKLCLNVHTFMDKIKLSANIQYK